MLLIVVSSTVGAHLLLGDLLWSPVGKCALALVATLLFACLGAGLVRWGAGRAGRMMLIATLIVVPIHFMLAGEMKLLLKPPAPRHVFLAIDALALIAMVRWVSGMLARPAGARFLTIALLLLSIGSAATTRGSPIAWELQFASFQLSPLVFLASVWILGARRWGDIERGTPRLRLHDARAARVCAGVLPFSHRGLCPAARDAPLYALPLMVGAISCVHAARRLAPYEPDAQRLALMRLGGYGLSGLAFALVLASTAVPSALHSGNSLAVAILGLVLYAASLRNDRHPAFLYLAVGAVVAGRLGAHYFLADRLHAIEEAVRQLLGYPDHLPTPFRAILGLIPNTALAGLALWFVKNWDDRRLARHCHYIGVPVIDRGLRVERVRAAGGGDLPVGLRDLVSAGGLGLRRPVGDVPGGGRAGGASYFASTRVPGITLADQALAAAVLGFAFWAARVVLRRRHAAPAYHVPWLRAALALTGAAMVAANLHLVSVGVGSWTGAGRSSSSRCSPSCSIVNGRGRSGLIWRY